MAAFPTTVATDSDLYIAVNATSTQLTDNPLSAGATTVNVTDATQFPTVGFISIDNEIIKYTGKTGTSFTGCTRASDGTSATSHVQNSQVFHNVIAIHHNALKNDLIATEQFISDLIGRDTTQIKGPNGTVSLPSHTFSADPDTGLYRTAANSWGLSAGGVISMSGDTNEISFFFAGVQTYSAGASFFFPQVDNSKDLGRTALRWKDLYTLRSLHGDGSVSLPSYSFNSDSDTGIYRIGADNFGLATGGVLRLELLSGSVYVRTGVLFVQDGSNTAPALSFANDTNTGLYSVGADQIGFATNGTLRLTISTTGLVSTLPLAMGTNKITGLSNGTAASDAAAFGQIFTGFQAPVIASATGDISNNTTTYASGTAASASITLTNSAHRVRIWSSGSIRSNAAGGQVIAAIFRDSTNLDGASGQGVWQTDANIAGGMMTLLGVDSPGDTSAHTYGVQIKTNGTGTGHFGDGFKSWIILEEIV